ncbi:hypothetical protein ABZ461_01825 [Actinacidiphila glaucinigra]
MSTTAAARRTVPPCAHSGRARAVAEEYGMARPAAECAALLAETGGEE